VPKKTTRTYRGRSDQSIVGSTGSAMLVSRSPTFMRQADRLDRDGLGSGIAVPERGVLR